MRTVIKTVKDVDNCIEIMKILDERERCDTRCVVMRWSVIKTVKDTDN